MIMDLLTHLFLAAQPLEKELTIRGDICQLGSHGPKSIIRKRDSTSQNKGPLALISREDLPGTNFYESKPLSSRQNDRDSSIISSHLTDGYSKESSCRMPHGYDRSKMLS